MHGRTGWRAHAASSAVSVSARCLSRWYQSRPLRPRPPFVETRNEDFMKQEVTVELTGGKRLTFETGRLAKQASGAVVVTQGDNVVLATAVAAPEPKEGPDFFPLTVDYRQNPYAGGRFP